MRRFKALLVLFLVAFSSLAFIPTKTVYAAGPSLVQDVAVQSCTITTDPFTCTKAFPSSPTSGLVGLKR